MPDIVIIGEAWGEKEEEAGQPFVGPSGKLLKGMLAQSGIDWRQCLLTNVINARPPGNDIKAFCGAKAEGIPGLPVLTKGKYLLSRFAPELQRLYAEIAAAKPNLILALGATASWAVLRASGIRKVRGTTALSFLGPKVLPTYHPAAVLREWALRPIVFADLAKAKREALFPEVRRPQREIWIEPTISDLLEFERLYIDDSSPLSIDVETKGDQITCFGVAPNNSVAIVVPLFTRDPVKSYWSEEDEVLALSWIRRQCLRPNLKIGQNFLYDLKFLWQRYGIPVNMDRCDDTMLMHHALQPEMEKGLGFLGSIYTDEASWKFMRKKSETIKTED